MENRKEELLKLIDEVNKAREELKEVEQQIDVVRNNNGERY